VNIEGFMAKWVWLWGKKRGSRMSGWWVVGSVSEAAFFGGLMLLGILSLTTIVTWQLFWPGSTVLRVGFGFWLMVIASSSFIVIGFTGFILQVSQTLASPELRSTLVANVKRQHSRRATGAERAAHDQHLPNLRELTDSPGTHLAYRLAPQSDDRSRVVLAALFVTGWNSMLAVLLAISIVNYLSSNADWFLTLLLIPFGAVSYFSTRWFFRLFREQAGIGPTAVEIDELPLLPGRVYQLYLCQYGRARFRELTVNLVGFEESTYQQGTDLRTERVEFARIPAQFSNACDPAAGGCVAEPEKPLELECQIRLPFDMMHSFQGHNNAVLWRIVVQGVAVKWPTFCRSFPVVVYPREAP
jgi:hypothetical protein